MDLDSETDLTTTESCDLTTEDSEPVAFVSVPAPMPRPKAKSAKNKERGVCWKEEEDLEEVPERVLKGASGVIFHHTEVRQVNLQLYRTFLM